MKKKTEFTKEYFIKKFKAIPSKEIGQTELNNHCALWHCGLRNSLSNMTKEAKALALLFSDGESDNAREVFRVNDGTTD